MNQTSKKVPKKEDYGKFQLGLAVVTLVAFSPFLLEFSRRLWMASHYSFIPLYIAAMGYFGWSRIQSDGPFESRFTTRSASRWVFPILCLMAAVWLRRPWFAAVAFVLALRAVAFTVGGRDLFTSVRAIWWCLWLCVPLPLNLDLALIQKMQHLASAMASRILDWRGFYHRLSGVLLKFPEKTFEIEEACSGVQSLYASIAAVLIYSIAVRRSLVRTLLLLMACCFWVYVMNVARILLVVVAETRWDIPLGSGITHDIVGYIVFALIVLAVVSTDRFMVYVLPEKSEFKRKASVQTNTMLGQLDAQLSIMGRGRIAPVRFVSVVGCLLCTAMIWNFIASTGRARPFQTSGSGLQLPQSTLPARVAGWDLAGFENMKRDKDDIRGEIAQQWTFTKSGSTVVVAIEGPFRTWHDIGRCYTGIGWRLTDATDSNETLLGEKSVVCEISMENQVGRFGQVAFTVCDLQGRAVAPPPLRLGATPGFRLQGGLKGLWTPNVEADDAEVYCIQAYSEAPLGFSQRDIADQKELLMKAAVMLREHMQSQEVVE